MKMAEITTGFRLQIADLLVGKLDRATLTPMDIDSLERLSRLLKAPGAHLLLANDNRDLVAIMEEVGNA
jgi:hypothetical protein